MYIAGILSGLSPRNNTGKFNISFDLSERNLFETSFLTDLKISNLRALNSILILNNSLILMPGFSTKSPDADVCLQNAR